MRRGYLAEREELGSNPLRICNINLAPPAETEIQLTAPTARQAGLGRAAKSPSDAEWLARQILEAVPWRIDP